MISRLSVLFSSRRPPLTPLIHLPNTSSPSESSLTSALRFVYWSADALILLLSSFLLFLILCYCFISGDCWFPIIWVSPAKVCSVQRLLKGMFFPYCDLLRPSVLQLFLYWCHWFCTGICWCCLAISTCTTSTIDHNNYRTGVGMLLYTDVFLPQWLNPMFSQNVSIWWVGGYLHGGKDSHLSDCSHCQTLHWAASADAAAH